MADNTFPSVSVTETIGSYTTTSVSSAIACMVGVSERGPVNKATLVTSFDDFVEKFGTYLSGRPAAYAVRDFFQNGGSLLYFTRVAHYTDITDLDTLSAVAAAVTLKDRTATAASKTTGSSTTAILWTAVSPGTAGNSITITLTASGNSTPLSVGVVGSAITVNLATDESGSPTSTCANIVAAVAANSTASALVSASTTGTGIPSAASSTSLSGGTDGANSVTITAADPGAWGNEITVDVSNGTLKPGYEFNLSVKRNGRVVETHRNLSLVSTDSNFVDSILSSKSTYINATTVSTSPTVATSRPFVGSGFALISGADGVTGLDDVDVIGDSSTSTGIYSFDAIDEKNLLLIPGIYSEAVRTAAVAYVENLGDMIYILDPPPNYNNSQVYDWRQAAGIDSSRVVMYWPRGMVTDPLTSTSIGVPPSGAVAGCIARTHAAGNVWDAPAGTTNGVIYGWVGLESVSNERSGKVLYPLGINCILNLSGSAITIWGQRTLTTATCAVDRLNVRCLVNYMRRTIGKSTRFVMFKGNNAETWRSLKRVIEPFLETIKSGGGLYDYLFVCDETTNTAARQDRNELYAKVLYKPTKTAEFVTIELCAVDTSVDFNEVLGE